MMLLHFLQRILNTLPRTFSSAIEYLAEQASQTIFIMAPERRASSRAQTLANNGRERPVEYRVQARTGATRRLGTLTSNICWRFFFRRRKGRAEGSFRRARRRPTPATSA